MIKARTVCVNCKHHCGVPPKAIWWEHYCHHPEFKRDKIQDPVTGNGGYGSVDDSGRHCLANEPYPLCREINRGNCEHFE